MQRVGFLFHLRPVQRGETAQRAQAPEQLLGAHGLAAAMAGGNLPGGQPAPGQYIADGGQKVILPLLLQTGEQRLGAGRGHQGGSEQSHGLAGAAEPPGQPIAPLGLRQLVAQGQERAVQLLRQSQPDAQGQQHALLMGGGGGLVPGDKGLVEGRCVAGRAPPRQLPAQQEHPGNAAVIGGQTGAAVQIAAEGQQQEHHLPTVLAKGLHRAPAGGAALHGGKEPHRPPGQWQTAHPADGRAQGKIMNGGGNVPVVDGQRFRRQLLWTAQGQPSQQHKQDDRDRQDDGLHHGIPFLSQARLVCVHPARKRGKTFCK